MKELFTIQNLIILISIYVVYKIYKFSQYINKYLVVYELSIYTEEIKDGKYYLKFRVNFGRGYFKKKYFHRIGELTSDYNFYENELRKLLSLTEIQTFKDFKSETKQVYKYFSSRNVVNNTVIYFKSEQQSVDEMTSRILQGNSIY